MGATADKIAKAILAHDRSGVIDLSRYRAEKAAVENARRGDDRLRGLLAKGYDPAHAAFIYAQNFASLLAEQLGVTTRAVPRFTPPWTKQERRPTTSLRPVVPASRSASVVKLSG